MGLFRIGARCKASTIVGRESGFAMNLDEPDGKAIFRFHTRYLKIGEERTLPGDFWVDMEVEADDLDGTDKFVNFASFLVNVISFASNAFIADLEPEVFVDVTPGSDSHTFLQRMVTPDRPTLTARFIDGPVSISLMEAVYGSPEREQLAMAISHYINALSYWSAGKELLVLAHLFMGAETMKQAAWKKKIREELITEEDLALSWGWLREKEPVVRKFLDGYSRRHLVFRGDLATHKAVSELSNRFEHGYASWHPLAADAHEHVEATATYLRNSILEVAGVGAEALEVLSSAEYASPLGPDPFEFRIETILNGAADQLAPTGQVYPMFDWNQAISEIEIDETARSLKFKTSPTLSPSLGAGTTFESISFKVTAPARFKMTQNASSIDDSEQDPSGARQIDRTPARPSFPTDEDHSSPAAAGRPPQT